jgi:hypothetical protein
MDKQKQIEEMCEILNTDCGDCENCAFLGVKWEKGVDCIYLFMAEALYNVGYRKIPKGSVVLTDDELNEVIDTCKVSMIVTDDDGEKYISLDDHNEYTERLGKLVRQRKARIEYLEKLLDDRCDRCIERERKETAEKFAKEAKQRLKDKLHRGKALHTTVFGKEYVRRIFKEVIDEVYNEITEGEDYGKSNISNESIGK